MPCASAGAVCVMPTKFWLKSNGAHRLSVCFATSMLVSQPLRSLLLVLASSHCAHSALETSPCPLHGFARFKHFLQYIASIDSSDRLLLSLIELLAALHVILDSLCLLRFVVSLLEPILKFAMFGILESLLGLLEARWCC